jgi:preprotein translocase subunit SecG
MVYFFNGKLVDIILLVLHVVLSLGIITLVLLQKGAGASAGASFGGGAAGSVFGASGSANFLSKTTAIFATAFFINSLVLAYLASNREVQTDSVLDNIAPATQVETTVEPGETPSVTEPELVIPEDAPDVPAADEVEIEEDVPPPAE